MFRDDAQRSRQRNHVLSPQHEQQDDGTAMTDVAMSVR
jgi:hypothetical protein